MYIMHHFGYLIRELDLLNEIQTPSMEGTTIKGLKRYLEVVLCVLEQGVDGPL